jgi:hypothetical protein
MLAWCGISILVGFWIMEITSCFFYLTISNAIVKDEKALAEIMIYSAKPIMITTWLILAALILNGVVNWFICRQYAKSPKV